MPLDSGTGSGIAPPGGRPSQTASRPLQATDEGLIVAMSAIPESGKGLRLPFVFQTSPLEEFKVGHAFEHADFMTVRYGQYSRPSGKQLRQVPFAGLILNYKPSWALSGGNIAAMVQELQSICDSGTPFHLIAFHPGAPYITDLEMDATMRTLDVTEKAGEPDTRYLDITFVEYRRLGRDTKVDGSGGAGGGGGFFSQVGKTISTSVSLKQAGGNKGGGQSGKTPTRVSPGTLPQGNAPCTTCRRCTTAARHSGARSPGQTRRSRVSALLGI